MKQATITMSLWKGHEVTLHKVTPAEVLFLVAEHHTNAGGDPVIEVKEDKEDEKRTNSEELERLKGKYSSKKLAVLFTGAMPNMPSTFAEARKLGTGVALPTQKLSETQIA